MPTDSTTENQPMLLLGAALATVEGIVALFPGCAPCRWGVRGDFFWIDVVFAQTTPPADILTEQLQLWLKSHGERQFDVFEMLYDNALEMISATGRRPLVGDLPSADGLVTLVRLEECWLFEDRPLPGDRTTPLPHLLTALPTERFASTEEPAVRLIGCLKADHKRLYKRLKTTLATETLDHLAQSRLLLDDNDDAPPLYSYAAHQWFYELHRLWEQTLLSHRLAAVTLPAPTQDDAIALARRLFLADKPLSRQPFALYTFNGDDAAPPSWRWGLWDAPAPAAPFSILFADEERRLAAATYSLKMLEQNLTIMGFDCSWFVSAPCLLSNKDRKRYAKGTSLLTKAVTQITNDTPQLWQSGDDEPQALLCHTDAWGQRWPIASLTCLTAWSQSPGLHTEQTPPPLLLRPYLSTARCLAALLERREPLPLWLAPEQLRLLSANEQTAAYTAVLACRASAMGIRCYCDAREIPLSQKVWEAEQHNIPHIAVIGPKEQLTDTLSLRRGRRNDAVATGPFLEELRQSNIKRGGHPDAPCATMNTGVQSQLESQ